MKINRIAALIIGFALSAICLYAQNNLSGSKAEGYRGIWFELGQVNNEYGDKYSGGLGTYTVKHIPMAIYAPEADKTFFVYGGTPTPDKKYLVCMAGCYDHRTGMLQRPVTVHDKGIDGVLDPHDNPVIQVDKDGYLWIFVAGRGNTRPPLEWRLFSKTKAKLSDGGITLSQDGMTRRLSASASDDNIELEYEVHRSLEGHCSCRQEGHFRNYLEKIIISRYEIHLI